MWAATGSPLALPAAIATGVFADADHVTELFGRRKELDQRYMVRFFHAWEYSIIAVVMLSTVWYHPVLLAAVLGHLSHLAIDTLTNHVHPLAYFMGFRISQGFKRSKLSPYYLQLDSPNENVPLWGRIEPWLWRIIIRIRYRHLYARNKRTPQ